MRTTSDVDDQILVLDKAPLLLRLFAERPVKALIRRFIERAKERGYIDSWSYHELHALVNRVFWSPL